MKKQDIVIGTEYNVKYSGKAVVILEIGGYENSHGFSPADRCTVRKAQAKTGYRYTGTKIKSDHLAIRIDTSDPVLIERAKGYTAEDFNNGIPTPEGAWLLSVRSGEIEGLWADELVNIEHRRVVAEATAKRSAYRKNVQIPQVKSQAERLGLNLGYISDYDTKVEMSFQQFLDLAARIETEAK
jgi:hypothetical protein